MKTNLAIDIIDVEDTLSAIALRSMLESYGMIVRLHFIATAADLVHLLNGATPVSSVVVLMCHGVEHGLYLPALAPEVALHQPYHDVITADDFRAFLHLPDCVVLNTGCSLGAPAFADAFLQGGCRAYIGATGDPDGVAALFYVVHFFYEFYQRGRTIGEAHTEAAAHDTETRMFNLYQRNPQVEQYLTDMQ